MSKRRKVKGACIFKRHGVGPWRIAYTDTDLLAGKRRRREYSTRQGDYAVACQEAERLLTEAAAHAQEARELAMLRRKGLTDPVQEQLAAAGRKPLAEHLKDFEAVLRGKGSSKIHVHVTLAGCREVIDACGFAIPADLDHVKLNRWITAQRDRKPKPPSARTVNRKVRAMKQFTRWLFVHERIRTDPFMRVPMLNADTDRRRVRRALSDEEIGRLLAAAEAGPIYGNMTGRDRAMIYKVALDTGLRASELRSLMPESFDLENVAEGSVTVEAAYSKHRREDKLPLRPQLAAELSWYLSGKAKGEKVFPLPDRAAEMLRADLEAAEIDEKDDRGRVVDFHALRHTFVTRLARAGVMPADAMKLARHSTIALTMDTYTHTEEVDTRAALNTLPALPPAATEQESRPAPAERRHG